MDPTGLPPSSSGKRRRKIYFESCGCSANRFDLEIILAILFNAGYATVEDPTSADLILVNTCGVKKPTEDKMLERLRVLSCLSKPLVVAGCLPKISLQAVRRSAPCFSAALDPHSVDRILEAVSAAENGETNRLFFSEKPLVKLLQPKVRLNRLIEIVQIAEGCTGACSYCCVRFARGRLFSYDKELIVDRVRKAVSDGATEIWITSQDNGAYGLDIGTDLAELLEECCTIEGEFSVRIGMMNPNHALRIGVRLAQVYKNDRIFKFLHIPVQSGDDEVLKRMNRLYTVEDFKHIVSIFRKVIPKLTLSTDVICGFPGETKWAFEKTVDLIEEVRPDIVNISKFFSRPHTPARSMGQLSVEEVRNRSRRLSEIVRKISFDRNKTWLNWEGRILIDEKGRNNTWVGRNYAYKPIVVESSENLLGEYVHVHVDEAFSTFLKAKISQNEPYPPPTGGITAIVSPSLSLVSNP